MNGFLAVTAGLLALQAHDRAVADPVEQDREWTEHYDVSAPVPVLEIRNIWGDVRVLPGPDGEITLAAHEHRSAPNQALFERSLEVLDLDIEADANHVSAVVGGREERWYHQDPCRACRVEFQFEVHVPVHALVKATTVNDGRVEISGIHGRITAGNVNGPVSVSDVDDCESVESVNGDVTLGFHTAPSADCHIETINGDIRMLVPGSAGLDVALILGNGRMTTEFPVDPLALPARVEHTEKDGRHLYRIEQPAGVRLAGGGPKFSIASMNGNLRIQKTQ